MTSTNFSLMLPGNSPVLIRASRLHDKLFAREFERARQVFADQAPYQCALDVIGKCLSVVDLVSAKRGFVAALRILLRPNSSLCRRIAIHDLDRHVAVAGEDKQPVRVGLVSLPVCAFLFERCELPRSDKPVANAVISTTICSSAILASGQRQCSHPDKQKHYAERKQFLHVRLPRHSVEASGDLALAAE